MFRLFVIGGFLDEKRERQPQKLRLKMPCDRRGIVRRGEKGRQWEHPPGKEKPSLNDSVPSQLVCGSRQRKLFRKFPLELRPDASGGRLKDQRAVPLSPGSADESLAFSTACPGTTSIVPLTRFVLTTVPAVFARRPWSVPAAISGTGLASAASSTSRPSRKFRLTHENSPLCSSAYSPAASFSCVTILPGIKETVSRSTEAARACWPVVRPEASTAQTRPWDQSKSGTNSKNPAHSPAAGGRAAGEKTALSFCGCADAPAACGQVLPAGDSAMPRTGP